MWVLAYVSGFECSAFDGPVEAEGVLIIIDTLNLRLLGIVMIDRWGMFGSSKKCVQLLPLH